MEWPSQWYLEEPRAIYQDWPMNTQFDLKFEEAVDSQVDLNRDCNIQHAPMRHAFDLNEVDERVVIEVDEQAEVRVDELLSDDSVVDLQVAVKKEPADLFPAHHEDDSDEEQIATEKAAKIKEVRSREAKGKAVKTREVMARAVGGTIDDVFEVSDTGSDDNRDPSDDDQFVVEESIAKRKRKSRAKSKKERIYYDDMKVNAHEQFALHLYFRDVTQLRKALVNYHIAYTRNFVYLKNNQERVVVCCVSDGTCPFMLYSSIIKGEKTHVIRQMLFPHTCGTTTETSRINSTRVANKYEYLIKSDPTISISAIIDVVLRDFGVEISSHMAYRARKKAVDGLVGDENKQYNRLRDYLATVMAKNLGSRCYVNIIRLTEDPRDNPTFLRLFYALHAQIEGFKTGCRPFIGIGGCFLKCGNGAQVLAASGRDGNNNLYPLAFGVVGTEDTDTWTWFLNHLKYALGGTAGPFGMYTFMSDRQKGLLAAVHDVFPDSSHRYYLRHIYANFQSAGFRGEDLKKILDKAAYAFDKSDYDAAMEELKTEDKAAWEWMCRIPARHWAHHALDTNCKTDLVVNNISEVFNNYILKVRDKPIVTMIDTIITKLMSRFASKREGVQQARWEITPTYVERLEWEKKNSRWCSAVCATRGLYQVTNAPRTYEVNLIDRKCGCFKWDLTGIPCKHVVCAIYKAKEFPEDYVSDFFKKPMYKEAYYHVIMPPWMD